MQQLVRTCQSEKQRKKEWPVSPPPPIHWHALVCQLAKRIVIRSKNCRLAEKDPSNSLCCVLGGWHISWGVDFGPNLVYVLGECYTSSCQAWKFQNAKLIHTIVKIAAFELRQRLFHVWKWVRTSGLSSTLLASWFWDISHLHIHCTRITSCSPAVWPRVYFAHTNLSTSKWMRRTPYCNQNRSHSDIPQMGSAIGETNQSGALFRWGWVVFGGTMTLLADKAQQFLRRFDKGWKISCCLDNLLQERFIG